MIVPCFSYSFFLKYYSCFAQLAGEKGHDVRVTHLGFAFLLIDRALSRRPEKGTDKFAEFLRTIPDCVAPLRDALVSRGHGLRFEEDGESFFDQQRLDILERYTAPSANTAKTGGRLSCTR